MATFMLVSTVPVGGAAASDRHDSTTIPRHIHLLRRHCSATTPLSSSKIVASGRKLGFGSEFLQGRRRGVRVLKAQEKDDEGRVDDVKPFYAASKFWIQVAVVVLTFGFVDAGYSGDWSRIGALSRETESQLRTAAYFVVPFSAALVWAIGKRKDTP